MPIFEFRCADCGHIAEKLIFNSQEKIDMTCPECKSENLERVVSRTGHVGASGQEGNDAKMTTRNCGPSNQCTTLDLPGPTK